MTENNAIVHLHDRYGERLILRVGAITGWKDPNRHSPRGNPQPKALVFTSDSDEPFRVAETTDEVTAAYFAALNESHRRERERAQIESIVGA